MTTESSNPSPSASSNPVTDSKSLVGLGGWLAIFIVTMFASIIMSIVNFFQDGFLSSSDVDTLNTYQPGLGDTFQALATFENVAVWIYVALLVVAIVMVLSRQKIGKYLAVGAIAFGALYTIIDSICVYSLFNSAGLDTSYLSSYAKSAGQLLTYAAIWIPYLFFSKRVSATLTKRQTTI